MTGNRKSTSVFIPRILLIPYILHFEFKRFQFPVKLSLAMSINNTQGSLNVITLHLLLAYFMDTYMQDFRELEDPHIFSFIHQLKDTRKTATQLTSSRSTFKTLDSAMTLRSRVIYVLSVIRTTPFCSDYLCTGVICTPSQQELIFSLRYIAPRGFKSPSSLLLTFLLS